MSVNKTIKVLPMQDRAQVIYDILKDRHETLLPEAMAVGNLDMWLIFCHEDNLDPVFEHFVPLDCWPPILQVLAFVRTSEGVCGFNISGTDTKDLYERPYKGQNEPQQYDELNKLLAQYNPQRIGVNTGSTEWCGGGLTVTAQRELLANIPEAFHGRLVSAEKTCTHFIQSMTPRELEVYTDVVALGQDVIAYTYHPDQIKPNETDITDLRWIYWNRAVEKGVDLAFLPYFRKARSLQDEQKYGPDDTVIRPGDAIHCDVGIKYLRYNSDHQEWAYVLRPGETDAPEGLKRILAQSNRLQDIFMETMTNSFGTSGNDLLNRMLKRAEEENITGAKIYSHSIGRFLHEPGSLIGLPWEQKDTGPRGQVQLVPNTCFSMELCSAGPVEEWGRDNVSLSIEQEVCVDAEGQCRVLNKRQTEFHLI